ncbi:5'-3' exonuclease PLD3 isoform X2 [Genypterus blacodes]|uniref:5'-3' exonuclease PLD3 isoform X2 n=1 Tax=Genypterus blacodes TaxID=154954 RepID=UPI003F763FFF
MESDSTDAESVQSQVMERDLFVPPQLEERAAEETTGPEVKDCAVVLDRLQPEDESPKDDLEDKDDMSRRSSKPVSRIPTFHKRPSTGSQNTELPLSKRDPPLLVAQLPEKAGGGMIEAPKSKVPTVRETALPLLTVRMSPKMSFEPTSPVSSTEQAAVSTHIPISSAPKSWAEEPDSGPLPLMAVTPRPALRPEIGSYYASEVEADASLQEPETQLLCQGSLSQKPEDRTDQAGAYGVDEDDIIGLTDAVGDEEIKSAEIDQTVEESFCEVKAITDEEPPWETEPIHMLELEEDNESLSETPYADDVEVESSVDDSGELKEDYEPYTSQGNDESACSNLTGEYADIDELSPLTQSNKPSKTSTKRSAVWSFTLCCILPTTLLLLGGFGLHVWQYGIPLSVAQLLSQLELHWLEGCSRPDPCSVDCRVRLVESTPEGLYPSDPSSLQSVADSWLDLLDKAKSSAYIGAFYVTLRNSDSKLPDSVDSQGRQVFEKLKQLDSKHVKLQIAVNAPQTSSLDTAELAAAGAEVREVNLTSLTGGIIHTKMWVVDQKHLYLGSANMDWRSLSQVKEVGLSVEDCSCLAQDALRIFGVYWSLGAEASPSLPPYWPARFSALSSAQKPLHMKFNGVPAQVYLSSAPPQISARGRSDDLTTILSVIADAKEFVHISVMDYLPLSKYSKPTRFWPAIDSALRAAACTRGVQVQLLVSCWPHSSASMFTFLQSLLVLTRPLLRCDIQVKVFTVPSTPEQEKIPYARVNHAKYMVTDRVLYIGTSNWSEEYFTQTAGVGLVVNQTGAEVRTGQRTLQSQAEELFLRDWNSDYAVALSVSDEDVCPRHRGH